MASSPHIPVIPVVQHQTDCWTIEGCLTPYHQAPPQFEYLNILKSFIHLATRSLTFTCSLQLCFSMLFTPVSQFLWLNYSVLKFLFHFIDCFFRSIMLVSKKMRGALFGISVDNDITGKNRDIGIKRNSLNPMCFLFELFNHGQISNI